MLIQLSEALELLGLSAQNPNPALIGRGNFNEIYQIKDGSRRLALRINDVVDPKIAFDRDVEYTSHRWAASQGIAPRVVAATNEFLCMDYVEGRHPTQRDFQDPATLGAIVSAIKKLHQGPELPISKSLFGRADFWYRDAQQCGLLSESLEEIWKQVVNGPVKDSAAESAELVHCHADLNPNNILVTNSAVMFIDFETAAMCSPYFDLSRLVYHLDSQEIDAKVLEIYFDKVKSFDLLQLNSSLVLQAVIAAMFAVVRGNSKLLEESLIRLRNYGIGCN